MDPTEEAESTTSASSTNHHGQVKVPRPNAVTKWNKIAADTFFNVPGPAGGAATTVAINLGMVQGAVYDAVNAITENAYQPYLLETRFHGKASGDAAVATAAYLVLVDIVSGVPATTTDGTPIAFPNRAALLAALDAEYTAALSTIPDSAVKTRGIKAGEAAAEAMIAARTNDGRFGASQWVPNPAPGHWNNIAPNGTVANDPTPWVGGVKPFLMESSSQFRSRGPNALTSRAYARDLDEVKALGGNCQVAPCVGTTPSTRTSAQTHIALFWQSQGGPALMWSAVARDLAEERRLDLADAARLLAMMNLSGADAAINCWNDKYHYDFWRPFQAIRRADEDGNPHTSPDPTWTPLIAAPYPDHTSGHLCLDGAQLRVLQMFFDTDKMRFGVTSSQFPGETRFFNRFSEPLDEIVEARIWAGLHFRTANLQGRKLGTNVANYMAENYFQPLDCDP